MFYPLVGGPLSPCPNPPFPALQTIGFLAFVAFNSKISSPPTTPINPKSPALCYPSRFTSSGARYAQKI